MYLLMVTAKVIPEKVGEAFRKFCIGEQPGNSAEARGMGVSLLIESMDEPGRITWLSTWNTLGNSSAFLSSPLYIERIAALQPYLLSAPQWRGYNILKQQSRDMEAHEIQEGGPNTRFETNIRPEIQPP